MDLFTTAPTPPLAELLRPLRIEDVVGQQHLLGPGKPLARLFAAKKLHSFVLWGPPGVGKTTLGRLMALATNSQFLALSAVSAGVKEIRAAADSAQEALNHRGKATVLFIDEIHGFSRTQQDALLPHVESGLITLVGSTTQHPGLQLTSALLSRAQVYALEPLSSQDFDALYARAERHLEGVTLEESTVRLLQDFADGDGRRFLNLVEQVSSAARAEGIPRVSPALAKECTAPSLRRFDSQGDELHWQLSAFHKSLRGSQPDAGLYWMARMLDGGGDARHIVRRMIAVASEDIGNADPQALVVALGAAAAYDRLGVPEGELALAQAVTYLATAPKSNAAYSAWKQAKEFVRKGASLPVPAHLRNAPTALMADMGYGQGYRYAHFEPNAYAAGQTYFPSGMVAPEWYLPSERGQELAIQERMAGWKASDEEAHSSTMPTSR